MRKIILECKNNDTKEDYKLASYFQGWLLEKVGSSYATEVHLPKMNAYTLSVQNGRDSILFIVTLLDDKSRQEMGAVLLDPKLTDIAFKSGKKGKYFIQRKIVVDKTQADLTEIFYHGNSESTFRIYFQTPTSFKSEGEYVIFPDVRLLIQSLMKKYNALFEDTEYVDVELLDELSAATRIVSYKLVSSYYPIHRTFIPGFKGEIKIRCKGNQTLRNYLGMLLEFANFSGIGIKTSMGMGAVKTEEVKKGEYHGRK